jgi:hypothetical protein
MTNYQTITKKVSDVSSYVKRQFGDESGVQITDDDIIRWINAGQMEIFRRNEPIKAVSTVDLTAGVDTYTFPSFFFSILKIQSMLVNNTPVEYRSYQEAEEYVLANDPNKVQTADTPLIWYEWGGEFTFWPVPAQSVTNGIKLRYIPQPATVTVQTDLLSVPDTYFNRLVEWVLSQAYELDEDWGAASAKAEQFGTNLDSQVTHDSVETDTYPRITVLVDDM